MPKIILLIFMSLSTMCFAQDSSINRKFSGKISGGVGISSRDIGTGIQGNFGYSWLKKSNKSPANLKIGHNFYINYNNFDTPFESSIIPYSSLSILNLCFDWTLLFQKVNRRPNYIWFFQPSIGLLVGHHSTVYNGENYTNGIGQYTQGTSSGLHLGLTITPISFEFPGFRQHLLIQFPIQFNAINFLNRGTPMPPLFCFNFGFRFN